MKVVFELPEKIDLLQTKEQRRGTSYITSITRDMDVLPKLGDLLRFNDTMYVCGVGYWHAGSIVNESFAEYSHSNREATTRDIEWHQFLRPEPKTS